MSAALGVTGGSDGIAAQIEDLDGMARLLNNVGQTLRDAEFDLASPMVRWAIAAGAEASACGADLLLAGLESLCRQLAEVVAMVGTTAFALLAAAAEYRQAERHAAADTGLLATALGGAAGLLSARGDLPRHLIAPGYTLPRVLALVTLDGHPVVHDLGTDRAATVAPRSLADLITGLSHRNQGRPGEISVSFVTGADSRRRAIVDLPGTKSWLPWPVRDVTSLGTDILAIAGRETSYEQGVFAAMTAAGVDRTTPVLLVGHSEGGIVAVDAARHAAASGRFAITHVVTAGAPIGELARDLPPDVQVLALENRADVVPGLDRAPNPDRRNVVTVRTEHDRGGVTANHDIDGVYLPEAAAADASGNRSVDDFLTGARGFLDGDGMTTHTYRITRGE